MANYRVATQFPSPAELTIEFRNQSESTRFRPRLTRLAEIAQRPSSRFVHDTIDHLRSHDLHPGVEDLLVLMRLWIRWYGLNLDDTSSLIYQAVKGLPSISDGRVGYTFNRRRRGRQRGVFLFLVSR
jgi:hypothetical protein